MADVKMVSLTIEGRPVTVPDGLSILEAAKTAGVLIPHYCYHPGLPVAGVCRMCLVEVEKFPKLAPACATSVMEGQVVHVHSPKALEARKGVLEFLLINHPLDCPICDQAGECELQDYTFAEGRADSRYREAKRFNPVEDFGGDVLYVPNRCILCTRCVRFMSDVAQEPVLNVSERGDRAFIGKAEGHDLTNPWAGNVVDLCPVGALLSKDFLNKARAWELDRAPTICTGCSQGCNAVVETRDNVVVRLKPRANDAGQPVLPVRDGTGGVSRVQPTRPRGPAARPRRECAADRRMGGRHRRGRARAARTSSPAVRLPEPLQRGAVPARAAHDAGARGRRVPRRTRGRVAVAGSPRPGAARGARRQRHRRATPRVHAKSRPWATR